MTYYQHIVQLKKQQNNRCDFQKALHITKHYIEDFVVSRASSCIIDVAVMSLSPQISDNDKQRLVKDLIDYLERNEFKVQCVNYKELHISWIYPNDI